MERDSIDGPESAADVKPVRAQGLTEHQKRVFTAIVAVPVLALVLTALWLAESRGSHVAGYYATLAVTTLVSGVLAYEILGLGTAGVLTRLVRLALAIGLTLGGVVYVFAQDNLFWGAITVLGSDKYDLMSWEFAVGLLAIPFTAVVAFLIVARRAEPSDKRAVTLAVLFATYAVLALNMIPEAYQILGKESIAGLAWLMAMVYGADIGAYYIGRRFGNRRLAPSISPKKTWEGLCGGVCVAFLVWLVPTFPFALFAAGYGIGTYPVGTVFIPIWFTMLIYFGVSMVLGLIVGVLGTLGDLFASKFKRLAGAKDSGNLFPGHGGLLDRVDSLLPNLVFLPTIAFGSIFYF